MAEGKEAFRGGGVFVWGGGGCIIPRRDCTSTEQNASVHAGDHKKEPFLPALGAPTGRKKTSQGKRENE